MRKLDSGLSLRAHNKLVTELIAMGRADQSMRSHALRIGLIDNRVDRRNTKKMKRLIAMYGWPKRSVVGKRASESAWLLAMHADLDPRFQKRCFALMQKSYRQNKRDVSREHLRSLKNRIRVNRERPIRRQVRQKTVA